VAAAGRLGWIAKASVYVEFDEAGNTITTVQPPVKVDRNKPERIHLSVALSDRGDVVLSKPGEDYLALWWLDRSKNRWLPVEFSDESDLEPSSRVLGFDGTDLVVLQGGLERGGYIVRYRRSP
jgi:hypothetical protein